MRWVHTTYWYSKCKKGETNSVSHVTAPVSVYCSLSMGFPFYPALVYLLLLLLLLIAVHFLFTLHWTMFNWVYFFILFLRTLVHFTVTHECEYVRLIDFTGIKWKQRPHAFNLRWLRGLKKQTNNRKNDFKIKAHCTMHNERERDFNRWNEFQWHLFSFAFSILLLLLSFSHSRDSQYILSHI